MKKDLNEMTQEDWAKSPVQFPYMRDLMIEAQRQLSIEIPTAMYLVLVEVSEVPAFGLHKDMDVLFYNPGMVNGLPFEALLAILEQIVQEHSCQFHQRNAAPVGAFLH